MKAKRAVFRNLHVAVTMALVAVLFLATQELRSQGGERLQALAANDTYPTFSLTLSPGTRNKIISEYRVGDVMWITITMTNLTNHDIDASSEWGSFDRMFQYEATDDDGKPVEKRHQGIQSYHHGGGIGAGGSVPREFQLERVFKITRPGKYTVRVSRHEPFVRDEKGEPPVVWSNPITIAVVAADPAPEAAK
jgi:hypothetical protein